MGKTLRRASRYSSQGWRATACELIVAALLAFVATRVDAQPDRAERTAGGRFMIVAHPTDRPLARALLSHAMATDSFPGLARPSAKVVIAIARDNAEFRRLIGPTIPEWGAAVAFPMANLIVLQGRSADAGAGDPLVVLRHELAHLALHEAIGHGAPRWFDEGYAGFAASEWGREQLLATNVALVWQGMPSLAELDNWFRGGSSRAHAAYALAYRAVAELDAMDSERGLALLFQHWTDDRSLDQAVRASYGLTLSAFEERWHRRTRLRYGVLALFSDITLAVSVFLVILFPLYMARRRRDRRRMAALRMADAEADRRAEADVVEALLGDLPVAQLGPRADSPGSSPEPRESR